MSLPTKQFPFLEKVRVLSHPTRMQIMIMLRRRHSSESEASVTEVIQVIGQPQAVVSQHLILMRRTGLLAHRKEGTRVYYKVADLDVYLLMTSILMGMSEEEFKKLTEVNRRELLDLSMNV